MHHTYGPYKAYEIDPSLKKYNIVKPLRKLTRIMYGPLHKRSVAHPFLLAAFHSKSIGEQQLSARAPLLEPFSINLPPPLDC